MDTITSAATPLRQRMLEDMRMRKLEPRTQEARGGLGSLNTKPVSISAIRSG